MTSKKKILLSFFLFLFCAIYAGNASWLRKEPGGNAALLAHRGVHQTFPVSFVRYDTCTAEIIDEPNHHYIENTHDSIRVAFSFGASVVELDIRATQDGYFAVFHDDQLDCRTNGEGPLSEYDLKYLQSLDIGYGYTFDGGKSFPLRGLGIAKMPSLRSVLDTYPDKRFLLHLKSGRTREADLLIALLASISKEQQLKLMVYGADNSVSKVLSQFPEMKGYTRSSVKKCLVNYALLGWSGFVPHSCRNTILQIPKNYAPYLWGWPRAFMSRMSAVDTEVILTGDYDRFSSGIDDISNFENLTKDYKGMIWTNKIELLGPHLNESRVN